MTFFADSIEHLLTISTLLWKYRTWTTTSPKTTKAIVYQAI